MNIKARLLAAASVALVFFYIFIVAAPQSASAGQSNSSSQHQGASQQETPIIETTQEQIRPTFDPVYLINPKSMFSPKLLAIFDCTFPIGAPLPKGCKPVPIELKVRIELTEVDPTVKQFLANAGFDPMSGVDTKQQTGRISPLNLVNLFSIRDKLGERVLKFVWLADEPAVPVNKTENKK